MYTYMYTYIYVYIYIYIYIYIHIYIYIYVYIYLFIYLSVGSVGFKVLKSRTEIEIKNFSFLKMKLKPNCTETKPKFWQRFGRFLGFLHTPIMA